MTTILAPEQQTITKPVFNHTTDNFGETSASYYRLQDGRKVEMSVLHLDDPCMIIASGTDEELETERYMEFLRLSKEEIIALRQLLLSHEVSEILGVDDVVPLQLIIDRLQFAEQQLLQRINVMFTDSPVSSSICSQ